jgi:hypothetical protein
MLKDFALWPLEFNQIALVDLRQKAVERLTTALAKRCDEALARAIAGRLGTKVEPEGLRGRLTVCCFQHLPGVDTYYLDGAPLLRLHPLQVDYQGNEIVAVRPIEYFTITEGKTS